MRADSKRLGRVVLLAAVFGAGTLARPFPAHAQSGEATPTVTPPQRSMPGGIGPDVLRKRLENLRSPGTNRINTTTARETPGAAAATPTQAAAAVAAATPGGAAGAHAPTPEPSSVKIGGGLVETNPKAVKPLPWNAKVSLAQIDDADLEEVIKTISRVTARNFLYDKKDVRNQKVTILAPSPLTVGEAYQAFQTVLESAGLTLEQVGPNLIRILPRRDAKQKPIDTAMGTDVPWNDSFVTRIIRLQNIEVGQIQAIIQQLAASDGLVQAFAPTNALIITDTANNIRRLSKIIDDLDKSGGEENIEVIKVKYADVQDVAEKINQLFGTQTAGQPGRPPTPVGIRRPPFGGKPGAPVMAGESPNDTALVSKVIADQRTNQLIVQANDRAVQALQDFLAKIDIPQDNGGANIHVYYLENGDAEEMATVLSNLASGIPGSNRAGAGRGGAAAGGFPAQPAAATAASGGAVAVLSGDVKITSDKATNALVITANKSDYEAIKAVIKQLDIRRRQVYVEAVIMEMTINKSRDLGLSFGGGVDAGRGAIGYGGLNAGNALFPDITKLATGFALGLLGPGGVNFTIPSTTPGGTPTTVKIPPFGVVLNALENDSDINVLSRPNVLAKENEEAEVIVATSVAVPGNVTISQTGLQNFSITHEDVGITLKVTPKINESDHLSLNIFQEVKSIVNDQTIGNQRLVDTGKRSAKTSVVVKSGQTVVIGGLLSDSDTRSEQKVPILGDIPLLGWLFRNQKHTGSKQNLVIFLTPTIINQDSDMDMIYQRRMKEREEFLRLYGNRALSKESKRSASLFERYWRDDEKEGPDGKTGKSGKTPDAKVETGGGTLFEPVHHAGDASEGTTTSTPPTPVAPAGDAGGSTASGDAGSTAAPAPTPAPPQPSKDETAPPPPPPSDPNAPKEPATP